MLLALATTFLTQVAPPTRASPVGTYEVRLCASPCDSQPPGELLAIGIVVLDSVPLFRSRYLLARPNACFQVRLGKALRGFAFNYPNGFTYWTRQPGTDSISFDTFGSVDAGHLVRAVLTDSGFVGTGRSWAGVSWLGIPDEYVIGRRLGPPDPQRCSAVRSQRRWAWFTPPVFLALAIATIVLATRID
jgi:hypothetical protein